QTPPPPRARRPGPRHRAPDPRPPPPPPPPALNTFRPRHTRHTCGEQVVAGLVGGAGSPAQQADHDWSVSWISIGGPVMVASGVGRPDPVLCQGLHAAASTSVTCPPSSTRVGAPSPDS